MERRYPQRILQSVSFVVGNALSILFFCKQHNKKNLPVKMSFGKFADLLLSIHLEILFIIFANFERILFLILFIVPSSLFIGPSILFIVPSSLFNVPPSLFVVPSSLLIVPFSLFVVPSSLFIVPSSLFVGRFSDNFR